MKKVDVKFAVIFMCICFLMISNVNAATMNAANCSQPAVQAAVNASSTGDEVVVPSGSCTWDTGITIHNKSINLIGAGRTNTIITFTPQYAVKLTAAVSGVNGSRISGIKFIFSGASAIYGIFVNTDGGGAPQGWRIDNCEFYKETFATSNPFAMFGYGKGMENGHPFGLIDNCIFYNTRVGFYGEDTSTGGKYRYAERMDMGTDKAIYVENCTITNTGNSSNCIDGRMGTRYVFRFNTVVNAHIEAHSLQYNQQRAIKLWEVYNNTLTPNLAMWIPGRFRGGTGVLFNNTIGTGYSNNSFPLDNVRDCSALVTGDWGMCDGTSWVDENESGKDGYPCRDQIGRSTDASIWDYTQPAPVQELIPAYSWNNKRGTTDVGFSNLGQCAKEKLHILVNRDYYNYTASFDGTAGVGMGALASRPATCTIGVAYWATDQGGWNKSGSGGQGVLYKCTSTNTWTVDYTPYTYPHPLRQVGVEASSPLTPPTPRNLRVVN